MQITLGERLGEGAFGDVYEAVDELGRRLAVKIIRPSAAAFSTALDHARALARAQHPNVVSIYSLEKVPDPDTGVPIDAGSWSCSKVRHSVTASHARDSLLRRSGALES